MAKQNITPWGRSEFEVFDDTSFNQCKSINPSNPLAVAQNIKGMAQLLKDARAWLMVDEHVTAQTLAGKLDEVLTAIEKG